MTFHIINAPKVGKRARALLVSPLPMKIVLSKDEKRMINREHSLSKRKVKVW